MSVEPLIKAAIPTPEPPPGTEIVGYHFIINVEKSRYVKEKSKIPVSVSFDGGIQRYSGLLDIAMVGGFVIKPSNGWYQRVDRETGELIGGKTREKDTQTKEFWDVILKNPLFQTHIINNFQIGHAAMMQEKKVKVDNDDNE